MAKTTKQSNPRRWFKHASTINRRQQGVAVLKQEAEQRDCTMP